MATVDKLLIKGIRSFSPENTHIITFPKPLTLIVGRNGSGKTTIIECLKHAVTGEWPPNSHAGKSFVHDPKVYGSDDVKAQIKLQCKTVTGKPFLVIRSFQLLRKRASGKYEFKSLDQNIQISNQSGEMEGLSKRCADINQEVPQLLGVSKAILENVIFVHQDESNWPLAEGAVLKKKFDDIFAATKYTKALEAIRKIKTEQAQGIREKKLALENLKTHKDNAHKLQTDLASADQSRTELVQSLKQLMEDAGAQETMLDELRAQTAKMSELSGALQVLKAKRDTTVAENQKRKLALGREVDDSSLEQLLGVQRDFEEKKAGFASQKTDVERKLNDLRIKNSHLKDVQTREASKQSRLAAEADMQSRRMQERQEFVAEMAKRHPDVGMHFAALPSVQDVHQFEQKVVLRLRALQKEHDDLVQANQERVKAATKSVDIATEGVASLAENLRLKTVQQRRNETQLADTVRQLAETPGSERLLAEEQSRLNDLSAQLDKKRSDAAGATHTAELVEVNKSVESLKRELAALRRERDELSTVAGVAGQMALLRRDADDKDDGAQKVYAACKSRLEELFGAEAVPDSKGASARLQAFLQEQGQAGGGLETGVRKQRNAVAALEGRITDARAAVVRLKDALRTKREAVVNSVLEGAPLERFPERLQASEAKVQFEATHLASAKAWVQLVDHGIQAAKEQHQCFMCERAFDGAQEAAFLHTSNERATVTLPNAVRDKERSHRAAADVMATLVQARPVWEECQRLQDQDVPQAEETLRALTADHAHTQEELAVQEKRLESFQSRLALAKQLSGETETIARLWREAEGLRRRADEQQRQISHLGAATKTLDQLGGEIGDAEARMSDLEHKRSRLQEAQQRLQGEVVNLERAVANCRESVRATQAKGERGIGLERERTELGAQTELLKRELQDLERRLEGARKDKAAAETARDQLRTECTASEQERGGRVRQLQRDTDAFALLSQSIAAYTQAGKDEALHCSIESLAGMQARLEENEQGMHALETELTALENRVRNHDSLKRDLDDTVAYLQGMAVEQSLSAQIKEKLTVFQEIGRYSELKEECEQRDEELQRNRNEQHMLRGRMETYQEQATKCRTDLKNALFKDIAERYRKANIELRTTEMATDDLTKYHTALDKALMAFHASKMAEINKVIRELWQKTYRNPDIDHIAIVSDAESTTGRSYNYRVVMKNRDEELDMRGRCSAGQKVLACLIIRLALAETFCLNCGILALDEPTTNLDAANSASLAQALTDIMNSRREQESFQLIVITHDIKFAHLIGQREHADFYWRISKDEELHSHIEKEDIVD